jgi:hypothetical protein
MSEVFTDQFSLLHFATGIIAYYSGLSLANWFLIHATFELFEDTQTGVRIINKIFGKIWPGGGKRVPDSFVNSELGDNFYAVLGWIFSWYVVNFKK